jgi:hypothetical protein
LGFLTKAFTLFSISSVRTAWLRSDKSGEKLRYEQIRNFCFAQNFIQLQDKEDQNA